VTQKRNTTASTKVIFRKIELIRDVVCGLIESRQARKVPDVYVAQIRIGSDAPIDELADSVAQVIVSPIGVIAQQHPHAGVLVGAI
jgi:mannose/fructose/N-acetylgalactosamine-specific phosphotransferase system component IID